MTGARILEVINYAPNVAGMIQPAGLKYKYYSYKDANPGPQPYAWGAYDVEVWNKTTSAWEVLDLEKTYKVGTNEFLAPAGGDGYNGFKYMTNVTYWGDMLNAVNAYVTTNYGTEPTAYMGPNGDGTLDGRITIDGNGDTVYDGGGEIIPLTILHHNDSHGNLAKGAYVGYTQLATLIKQEKQHNPTRTLLLNSGDNIQGDGMMYYYKSAPTGFASDGTPLPPGLQTHPMMAVMNSMDYDAMVLGNHEFNFGKDIFRGVMGQATFPVLQANLADDGAYGLSYANGGVGVQPYITKTLGAENIDIAILGIGNHRVPNYELPSNIPGLTFSNPLTKAQELSDSLRSSNDVVIALTHIGFTENPASVEVDTNVDTNLAATVTGIDAIVGGHSHTDPSKQTAYSGNYKFLPSIVAGPDNNPVIIGHAYRYNNTLGEIVLGLRDNGAGGYEVVSQTGRYLTVTTSTAEDPDTKTIVDPYLAQFSAYNDTVIGETTAPIDTLQAYTQETNGANLQADASVYELNVTHSIPVDFHLSGAMTNKLMANGATPSNPVSLKISDMFAGMPYENSLVVISMNGPQIKAVLERGYRNYYYYKYVPGYGGYSYYTTCMLDTNFGNQITYNDLHPALPNGHNVASLKIAGVEIDFTDAATYYNVSTVNYLAAGSCNFNDAGATLWPLNQIVADTQYYVRDAVINYTAAMGTISPAIEGRLAFVSDSIAPTVASITRNDSNPTTAASVNFTVTFSEDVNSVAAGDFAVNTTGSLASVEVTDVSGSGDTYIVTASTGTGSGTLRLDIPDTATIIDLAGNPLSGLPYTGGEAYTVEMPIFGKTAPADSATAISLSPTLSWNTSDGATSYEYCYSSVAGPCTKWNSVGANTSATLSGLAADYTYYWQVRAVDAGGATEADGGTWWSFTTTSAPSCTFDPYIPPSTPSFVDVPEAHWAWDWIERFYSAELTTGCAWVPGGYCPGDLVTREQMAVFIMRAKNCGNYTPAPVTGPVFSDVPASHWAAGFIRDFANQGITTGCAWVPGGYCPGDLVTREQMAVFVIRATHGGTYSPPAVTGPVFTDVPASHWAATFIKQFHDEGITTGCSWVPGGYCPGDLVTREQMAVFIGRAFKLP
jgi:2',3'-cyclic-nucleotide 2'-phosphodiesterase (5'-nucleotidase family)